MAKRGKTNKGHQPHDEFVKFSLSDKSIATDLIKQFLPEKLVQNLDFSSLELDTSTYVTPELKTYFSDLVWLCRYKSNIIQIAFLIEHKSSPVKYPHLQLLRYMLEIWEVNQRNKKPFLPIIPIILYHGKEEWDVRPMSEYFNGIDADLVQYLPQFNYELVNIGQYSEDDILEFEVGLLKNVLLALRFYRDLEYLRNKFGAFFIHIEGFESSPQLLNFVRTLFVYLLKTSEFSDEEINEMFNQIPSPINEMTMSSYDVVIEKGIERGIERGIETGIEKEKIEVIKNARLEGATIEFIAKIVNLPISRVRQILDELGLD